MNDKKTVDATAWAVLRPVSPENLLPHLFASRDDLLEDLRSELKTYDQMRGTNGLFEIPLIESFGIATGPGGEIGLFALGNKTVTGGRQLWPVKEIPLATDASPDWYEQQRETGYIILIAYTDIFLAACVAEHEERIGPAQAKRLVETSLFGAIQAFQVR